MAGNKKRTLNHWDVKCTRCGHRKGCHQLNYGGPGSRELVGIGHCFVSADPITGRKFAAPCVCFGFTDGTNWKDGLRISETRLMQARHDASTNILPVTVSTVGAVHPLSIQPRCITPAFTEAMRAHAAEETTAFEGGATRSKMDVRYDLLPREALDAMARRLTLGAAKHGENNWKEGGPEFVKATINHLINHVLEYLTNGNENDANTDAIICNAAFLCYFEARKSMEAQAVIK